MQVSEHDRIARTVAERERTGRETATAERLAKAGLEAVEHTPAGVQRVSEAPLDRLLRTDEIGPDEFEAGDRFRNDAHVAGIDPGAPSVDWNALGGGFGPRVPTAFSSQKTMDARRRWRAVHDSLGTRSGVWSVLWLALVREQSLTDIGLGLGVSGRKEAIAAAKASLVMALGVLAEHYRGTR